MSVEDTYFKTKLEDEATDIIDAALLECKTEVEGKLALMLSEHAKEETEKYTEIHKQLIEVKAQLEQLMKLFEQGKGAVTVIKWAGYSAVGFWALVLWAKDHIRI